MVDEMVCLSGLPKTLKNSGIMRFGGFHGVYMGWSVYLHPSWGEK